MKWHQKLALIIATGGGVGYLPKAPGTFGSLLALPFCYVLSRASIEVALTVLGAITCLAVIVSSRAEKILKTNDPGCIVIDEIAGQMFVFTGLVANWPLILVGFLLFRLLDIAKPFPMRWLDQRLTGGLGIVADDVLAGIIGNGIIRLAIFII